MEAVPRLPMLSFELKSSPENTEFGPKLKKFIREHYNEDAETYQPEIKELEALRYASIHCSRDYTGCSTLKRYYSQLHLLQRRFPMTDEGAACVVFMWNDIYSGLVFNITDIKYEQACILYNIGALHSDLGAIDNRQTSEGMKISCTHFQCAAWAFQHLRDNFPQPKGSDMSNDVLSFFINVMLGQAQECILEKSMLDNRKCSIIAKVAAQISDYYRLALKMLEPGSKSSDSVSIPEIVGSKLLKTWQRYLQFKNTYHLSIAYMYMGNQAEEQQRMGERLGYLQAALDKLNEAVKLSKHMDKDSLADALSFTMDVVGGKYEAAKKENDFIYHEKVPAIETLPVIKGASLVKGIPFFPTDPEVSGPDIFGRLVSMETHEASSLYSEEKAKLFRNITGSIEERNQELEIYLASLQLDCLQLASEQERLPQELIECCAALSLKPNVIKDLIAAMQTLSSLYHDVESSLREIDEMLTEDEAKEKEYKETVGQRGPSMILLDIRKEWSKYQEAHTKASESNTTLHRAMNLHVANLRLLAGSMEELQKALPSLGILDAPNDEGTVGVQRLVSKVEEMKVQRQTLEAQLREQIQNDDITKQLVACDDNLQEVFQRELKKHSHLIGLLEQNLAAQDNILRALTDANARYADTRKATNDVFQRRKSMIHSLISSYETYEDLVAKSQKGLEFYKKLEANTNKLLQRTRGVCSVQEEERMQLLEKVKKVAKKPSGPTRTSEATPGPKLKDYLAYRTPVVDHEKMKPIPPDVASAFPTIPMTSFPTVNPIGETDLSLHGKSTMMADPVYIPRPAPLGSEHTDGSPHHGAMQVSSDYNRPAAYDMYYSGQQPSQYCQMSVKGTSDIHGKPDSYLYQSQIPPAYNTSATIPSQFPQTQPPIATPVNPGPLRYMAPVTDNYQSYFQQQHSNPTGYPHMPSSSAGDRFLPTAQMSYSPTLPSTSYSQSPANYFNSQNTPQNTQYPYINTGASTQYPYVPGTSTPSDGRSFGQNTGNILQYTQAGIVPTPAMVTSYQYMQGGSYPGSTIPEPGTGTASARRDSAPSYATGYSQMPVHNYNANVQSYDPSAQVPSSLNYSGTTSVSGPSSFNPLQNQVPALFSTQQPASPTCEGSSRLSSGTDSVQSYNPQIPVMYHGFPYTVQTVSNYIQPEATWQTGVTNQQQQPQPPLKPQVLTPTVPQSISSISGSNLHLLEQLSSDPIPPQTISPAEVKKPEVDRKLKVTSSELNKEKVKVDSTVSTMEKPLPKDPYSDPETLNRFLADVDRFEKLTEGLTKQLLNGPTLLDQKWKEVMDVQDKDSRKLSISVARCYSLKNRLADVMPYDSNRVQLVTGKDDYINASHVKDLSQSLVRFIATQCPLPHIAADFWQMVYEQQAEMIACVMSDAELKQSIYWPQDKNQMLTYGQLIINLQSSKAKPWGTERILVITHQQARSTRVVIHLQCTMWPPSENPGNIRNFLDFVGDMHAFHQQQRNLTRPIVVHCSAGVGRTGVLMLVIAAVQDIAAGRGIVDIAAVAAQMTQMRKFIFQDKEQLRFCYEAVLYYARDILMKRGILSSKPSFDEKLPSTPKASHTRHPSQDFILGNLQPVAVPPGSANTAVTQSDAPPPPLDKQNGEQKPDSVAPLPVEQDPDVGLKSSRSNSIASSISSVNSIDSFTRAPTDSATPTSLATLVNLDASNFSLDPLQSKSKHKIRKENFLAPSGSGLKDAQADLSDPLNLLDPLWTHKKEI